MRMPFSSRSRVLERIHKATASVAVHPDELDVQHAALPRQYFRKGTLSGAPRIALLRERLRDYGADVTEIFPGDLPACIRAKLAAAKLHSVAAPPGLRSGWMAPEFDWKIDNGLSYEELERVDGVVTGAACAIADSGTIVLHHSQSEGRRVLTLLPDWHLCILFASQVVETFPEYFARVQQPPALVTWISGPSATADIEMTRIQGVHGPRHLSVILVLDEA